MDVWIASARKKVALLVDSGVVIDPQRNDFAPLGQQAEPLDDRVVLFRCELRGQVVVMSGDNVSLIVNGSRVICGLHLIDSNSVVRLRRGQSGLSLAVLFDDSVVDVSPGSACDICGKVLVENGKGHCRKKLCTECVEALGSKCPDCGRELLDTNVGGQVASEMQEYILE